MLRRIAFLGMGLMGAPMAANLARADYNVTVWNRTPGSAGVKVAEEAGAAVVASIAEAVSDAEIVMGCVSDGPDVEAVLLGRRAADSSGEGEGDTEEAGLPGVIDHAATGALVIDFSTIGPVAARSVGSDLAARGLRFLDAPVSGGDVGARAGTLTVMVGGEPSDFEEARPLLEVVGSNVHHCGPLGSGQAVKLCNQILAALHMTALTEALRLAETLGVDPALVVQVCKSGAAGSWALEKLGPRVIAKDFAPGFMIKHLIKDLGLIRQSNDAGKGPPLAGTELASYLFEAVAELDEGSGGDLGTQALTRAYD